MKRLAVFLIWFVAGIVGVAGFAQTPADSIRLAYERLMMKYPLCEQRDVYKNFFQDYFGPGHIVTDTASAAKYLRHELEHADEFGFSFMSRRDTKGISSVSVYR